MIFNMDNKKLVFFDKGDLRDKCCFKDTSIDIKCHETGEVLFKSGRNKVIVSGSAFTAAKHFNITPDSLTTSYNNVLGLDNTVNEPSSEGPGIRRGEQVFLFAMGTDGCGTQPSQVAEVDYGKWIAPADLIPFRYQRIDNDLTNFQRAKYFGRKTTTDRIVYYFKTWETPPVFKQQYSDGTPIDENVYYSDRTDEIESYVELNLTATKEDFRDYFLATTGINDARVNSISLLTAWAKVVDGFTYYQDIRPLTKYNFPTESLIDITKGLDIVYHIYY